MINLDGLVCPNCRTASLVPGNCALHCKRCVTNYAIQFDIIDFRDADADLSEQFDIVEDRAVAAKLVEVYSELRTFNELRGVYFGILERLKRGVPLKTINPRDIICEDLISPSPMTGEQLLHGDAVSEKLPLYLNDAGLPALRTNAALEDGAGEGFFVNALAKQFGKLYVLDISMPLMLLSNKIIEERGLTNVTLVCASAERLPLMDAAVDFVHSNNVIEHISDQDRMFAEAHRVLTVGGLMFVISPNKFSLYYEPHFRVPLYGFIPKPVRRFAIKRWQNRDIDEIKSLSLAGVRELANAHFASVYIGFVPSTLRNTATGGFIRRALTWFLASRETGRLANWMINKAALPVMPYHVLLCRRDDADYPRTRDHS